MIIDLAAWRSRHTPPAGPGSGDQPEAQPGRDDRAVDRLDRAVERLHALVRTALRSHGELERSVETELLAIMGELTVGLVDEAATRAERLAGKLAGARGG